MILRDLLPLLSGPKHSAARMAVRTLQAMPLLGGFLDVDVSCQIDRQAETLTLTCGGDSLTLTFAQLEAGRVESHATE